jgi:hypothetical protein
VGCTALGSLEDARKLPEKRKTLGEMGQGQQVTPGGGPRDAGPLGRQGGIQTLSLHVKTLEHRHALGHAFNQVGFGDGGQGRRLRSVGWGGHCAMIAQLNRSSRKFNQAPDDGSPAGF